MLRSLHISNLAVIASADVELADGLNVFTGATGAGKSLLIGALEVLLGLRSAGEMLRAGADEARVSGLFHLNDEALARQLGELTDAPIDDGELLLTRRIWANGRTAATVNGKPIAVTMLKELAERLVDIHGQHDHQYLLKPVNQLELLDEFAGLFADGRREQFARLYQRWRDLSRRRQKLAASAALRARQLELAEFQADEIDQAELADGELEALEAEHRRHANAQKLIHDAGEIHAALYEADGSLLERLSQINAVLRELALLDETLKGTGELLGSAMAEVEEAAFDLRRYTERLALDPERAAFVEDRLNLVNRLLSKYGQTIADVLTFRDELGRQLTELRSAEADHSHLDAGLAKLQTELLARADALHAARVKAAAKLGRRVESEMDELGMGKAKMAIEFAEAPADPVARLAAMGPTGLDPIEIVVTTNPGQPPRSLRKIASGGEISRIMLALKAILARSDRISVLVFDEIDANVGGRLGSVIGAKLAELAAHHQVLCITHLPQIAAFAERQLTVRKTVAGGGTQTAVEAVHGDGRVEELAEMIGGANVTSTTRRQAQELLSAASRPTFPAPAPGKRRSAGGKPKAKAD